MSVKSLSASKVPLGPLASRTVDVLLEDGGPWWQTHLPSCPEISEETRSASIPFLEAAALRTLCATCLPAVELLLPVSARPYFRAADVLSVAAQNLISELAPPYSTWVQASDLFACLTQLEQLDVSEYPELHEYHTGLVGRARSVLEDTISRLRARGDERLLALYAALSLRSTESLVWAGSLTHLEAQTTSLLRYASIPLLPRLVPRASLSALQERLASRTGTVSICGPLPANPGNLRVLFRIALLRWGGAATAPVVFEVPALVADVLSPLAPTLCEGPVPPEVAETFLVLWDGTSDPRLALEASGALLS